MKVQALCRVRPLLTAAQQARGGEPRAHAGGDQADKRTVRRRPQLVAAVRGPGVELAVRAVVAGHRLPPVVDRKSTRLNSSHANISYAAFCLKKKQSLPPCSLCRRRATAVPTLCHVRTSAKLSSPSR